MCRYREKNMLSVFVNLFAAIAYVSIVISFSFCLDNVTRMSLTLCSAIWQWAKLCSHMNNDEGPAAAVVSYKYLDYAFTCPLLTADLLWSLNLPYKFTYAGFVSVCLYAPSLFDNTRIYDFHRFLLICNPCTYVCACLDEPSGGLRAGAPSYSILHPCTS